jgi:virginiamycin B lyase
MPFGDILLMKKKFEMYKIPTRGSYPASLEFDSKGNVWFSEIFGKKLGSLNPTLAENNTSKGIIWFSAVDYPYNGSIVNYNITSKKFDVFPLTKDTGIPISIMEDNKQNLWINDHATSLFFKFDPHNGNIKKYTIPTIISMLTIFCYIALPFRSE